MPVAKESVEYRDRGNFEAVAEDMYPCKLADITEVDSGVYGKPGEVEKKLMFKFEAKTIVRDDNSPVFFFHRVRPIYGPEKANLTLLMDKMLGRRLTADEWAAFDINSLIGKNFNVLITNTEKDGNVYNNVASVNRPQQAAGVKPAPAAQSPAQAAPVATQAQPAPTPAAAPAIAPDEDLDDPFAE